MDHKTRLFSNGFHHIALKVRLPQICSYPHESATANSSPACRKISVSVKSYTHRVMWRLLVTQEVVRHRKSGGTRTLT